MGEKYRCWSADDKMVGELQMKDEILKKSFAATRSKIGGLPLAV